MCFSKINYAENIIRRSLLCFVGLSLIHLLGRFHRAILMIAVRVVAMDAAVLVSVSIFNRVMSKSDFIVLAVSFLDLVIRFYKIYWKG